MLAVVCCAAASCGKALLIIANVMNMQQQRLWLFASLPQLHLMTVLSVLNIKQLLSLQYTVVHAGLL